MERLSRQTLILIAGLAVAVIALIVMIVLFFVSQTERELVYAVNPVKTRIVTTGQATGLEISYKGLEIGNSNVTAAQVAIWNSGDESIRKENVLKEVTIYTDPPSKILEALIVKSNRELEITNFSLLASSELMENGKLAVSWNILEKDDGASIQLIYLGSPEVEIKAEGLIEGSGEIKRVGREVKIKTPAEQFESAKIPWFIYLFLGVIAITVTYWGVTEAYKDFKRERKKSAVIDLSALVIYLSLVAFFFWYFIGRGPLTPPFGF